MRGIPSLITDIRKQVFAEVARMAYSGDYTQMEDIPFRIVPGTNPLHRESVFLERAIAGERVRLAMGLSLQPVQTRTLLTEGMDQAAIAEQYYEAPLVNIIPYACHACPTKQYRVTELCQGCLAASCQRVCPKGAVKFVNGKSRIDQKLCIKCGKCAKSCPYHAITYLERPCQAACGMDAIGVDEYGKAKIDYDLCVSCGQCLVNCPFGAIVDKSQIYQVIRSILEGNDVVAIVAPSFAGQFGKDVTAAKFVAAMKALGFSDVVEVAAGADWRVIPKQRWSRKQEACMDEIEAAFTYPVFVKPAGTGSSVGISKAKCREDLEQAVTDALRYGNKALVEEFIDGQEIEVAVLGNESPCASVCGEIDAGAEFYDYEAKYLSNSASFYVPARIDEAVSELLRETAVKVYRAMECRGLARVDFFVRRDDQEVVFNEINTIPGFTSISMYPRLFAASGIEYPELIDNLIALALEE